MDVPERITRFLQAQNVRSYLVGGTVRDELLERKERRDVDISVVGDATALARAFADQEGGALYVMDAEHNVARVLLNGDYVDLAELRGSLDEDLATRDFTINAMAREVGAQAIVDPYGGESDLSARQVRALDDRVFQTDPVRLLRGVRLAVELEFAIESRTEEWIRRDAGLLESASMERARDELFKILALAHAFESVQQMDRLGLLDALLPELRAGRGVRQPEPHIYDVLEHSVHVVEEMEHIQARGYAELGDGNFNRELQQHFQHVVSGGRTRGLLLRFTGLLHDIGKPETRSVDEEGRIHFIGHENRGAALAEDLMRRLRMSKNETEIVTRAIREHLRPAQLARAGPVSDRAIYRFFRDAGPEGLDICVLALADVRAKAPAIPTSTDEVELRETLNKLLDRYFRAPEAVVAPSALVDGRTLMRELNMRPGPRIGEILESIREAQVEGQVKTREEALAMARELAARGQVGR